MTTEVLRYAAFTRDGRGGNPAGVVLGAESLTDAQMLSVAADLGYSETAFVLPDSTDPGRVRLRYFSPQAEVAFCGHATVATAVAIADREGPGRLDLSTMAGPVTVRTERTADGTTATLTSPPARSAPVEATVLGDALAALGWRTDDLDPSYPPHVAFAGNHHLVIGVRAEDTLAGLDYDYDALAALMAGQSWTTVHAFWAETSTTFQARNPFPPGGVVEDPATGAAAAAFGGYLRALRGDRVPSGLTIHQGHHMGSPSRLLVELAPGTDTVQVSGAATALAASSDGGWGLG